MKTLTKGRAFGFSALVVFLLLMASPTHAQQQAPTLNVSLEELLNSGLEGNSDIVQAYLDLQKAEAEQKAVAGGFLPQVNLSGQYDRNIKRPVFFFPADGGGFPGTGGGGGTSEGAVIEVGFDNSIQTSAQAELPIYNRELIENNRLAKTSIKISQSNLDINKNELTNQIRKSFYEVLFAQESLRVLEASLENAIANFENIQNQFSRQLVPEFDVIRAEVQVENLRPDIIQSENELENAINQLKLLANIPEDMHIDLGGDLGEFYDSSINEIPYQELDLSNNPTLAQVALQTELQENQLKLRQAGFTPSVSTFANYAILSQANNFNFSDYFWVNTAAVGLRVNIPVFQGFSRNRRVEQARLDVKQAEVQKEYTERSLNIQAQNALNRMERALKSMKSQEKNIAQAERGYQIAQVSYSNGMGTLIEVNDAELAMTQARLNVLQTKFEFLTAMSDLKELSGEY